MGYATIIVPIPEFVKISRSKECSILPSIMCAALTPCAKALMQHSVFGIIPSVTIFFSIKSLASLRFVFSTRLFLLSFSFKIP